MDACSSRPGWDVFKDGCPHREATGQAAAQADLLIARLRSGQGNVALCSHGQFACAPAARWSAAPVSGAEDLALATASLGSLRHNPAHPDIPVITL